MSSRTAGSKTASGTIYERLMRVQSQVAYLQKGDNGPQYKYNSSSQVLAAIRPLMDAENVLLLFNVSSAQVLPGALSKQVLTEMHIECSFICADKPEDRHVFTWYAQGADMGEKGPGKAMTYAEKMVLLKTFHVATDAEDPDAFQQTTKPAVAPEPQKVTMERIAADLPCPVEAELPIDCKSLGTSLRAYNWGGKELVEALAAIGASKLPKSGSKEDTPVNRWRIIQAVEAYSAVTGLAHPWAYLIAGAQQQTVMDKAGEAQAEEGAQDAQAAS